MERFILAFFALAHIFFIIGFELHRKKRYAFDALSLFNLFFLVYYPFATINLLLFPDLLRGMIQVFYAYAPRITIWTVVLQFVYYFSFVVAYLLSGKHPVLFLRKEISSYPELNSYVLILYCGFFVSLVALYLWASQYGGLYTAISLADSIREGNVTQETRWAFMQQFYLATPFLAAVFCYVFVKRKYLSPSRLLLLYGLLPFALFTTVSVFLIFASRGKIIFFAFSFALILLWKRIPIDLLVVFKKRFSFVVLAAIISMGSLYFGNAVFSSLKEIDRGSDAFVSEVLAHFSNVENKGLNKYFIIVSNFLHYSYSIDTAIDSVIVSHLQKPSYGYEAFDAVVTLLPSRFTGRATLMTLQYRNNLAINPLRNTAYDRGGGSIPAGAIGGSIYMFSFVGPFLLPILLGVGIKRIEILLLKKIGFLSSTPLLYIMFIFMTYPLLIGFDPHVFKMQVIPLCWWGLFAYTGKRHLSY